MIVFLVCVSSAVNEYATQSKGMKGQKIVKEGLYPVALLNMKHYLIQISCSVHNRDFDLHRAEKQGPFQFYQGF
jgi:hypothetical protein